MAVVAASEVEFVGSPFGSRYGAQGVAHGTVAGLEDASGGHLRLDLNFPADIVGQNFEVWWWGVEVTFNVNPAADRPLVIIHEMALLRSAVSARLHWPYVARLDPAFEFSCVPVVSDAGVDLYQRGWHLVKDATDTASTLLRLFKDNDNEANYTMRIGGLWRSRSLG